MGFAIFLWPRWQQLRSIGFGAWVLGFRFKSLGFVNRHFELDEPRFEYEIFLPKLKFELRVNGMDMS